MRMMRRGLGLLSLAALLLSGSNANAWFWNHCGPCYHHGHHCFETHITCRPYNAFTPICWGNLTCDGCCPSPCAVASGAQMMPSWGGCSPPQFFGGYAGGCTPGCGGCSPSYGMPSYGMPSYGMPSYGGMPGYGGMSGPSFDSYQGGAPMMPGGSFPPMPTQIPSSAMPPLTNHTTQYGNPAMYYGVQPANYYPGYYYGYPMPQYPNYQGMPYGYSNNPQRPN
jgi:hypothetical protein